MRRPPLRRFVAALVFVCYAPFAAAQSTSIDVTLHGLYGNRAVVSINNASPRTVSVGQTLDGVKLVAIQGEHAVIEVGGRKRTIEFGANAISFSAPASSNGNASVQADANDAGNGRAVLQSDSSGHFLVQGQINGLSVRMLLDTGATFVVLPAADARRLGIDYLRKGQRGAASTANGVVPVWRVKLDSIRVQGITLYGIDATVQDAPLPIILLGNSFLSRLQMQRNGDQMTLTQRY